MAEGGAERVPLCLMLARCMRACVQVSAAVPKKSGGMILVCNIGGTLEPTGERDAAESKEHCRAAIGHDLLHGQCCVPHLSGCVFFAGPSEFGRQSRSLTAAYELVQAGFSNIKVLEGGYNAWARDEREVEMVQ